MLTPGRLGIGMVGYAFMGAAHSQGWRNARSFFDPALTPDLVAIGGRNVDAASDVARRFDWRHVEKGKPFARGLEFGTTSLPHPDSVLIAKGHVFGRPIIAHLDAGQTETRSYAAFLFKIPKDYRGVAELVYDRRHLVLKERFILYEQHSPADRDLVMETGDLFGD